MKSVGHTVARGALVALVVAACLAALLYAGERFLIRRTGQSWLLYGWNDLGPVVYDPLLGWTSPASTVYPDLYGPARTSTYNARAFRSTEELDAAAPEDRMRVLCLGDSFMDGLGLDDADTIPAQMERLDGRLEAVNMAKISFGLDQAVLRYERDADGIEADIVLLAAIDDDLNRARWDHFFAYWPKPRFRVAGGGSLELVGTPVEDFSLPVHGPGDLLRRSGLYLLLHQYVAKQTYRQSDEALATGILDRLVQLADRRGQRVVLAYLPTRPEVENGQMLPLASLMEGHAARHGLGFVQVSNAFEKLDDPGDGFLSVNDHYNELGAGLVARLLVSVIEDPQRPQRMQ